MIFIHYAAARSCFDKPSTKGQGLPRKHRSGRPEPVEGRAQMDSHQGEIVQ
jgi:hypothetical protein